MIPYPDIDPIAFQIGPVAVRWYGISYVVGIGAMWLIRQNWQKKQIIL